MLTVRFLLLIKSDNPSEIVDADGACFQWRTIRRLILFNDQPSRTRFFGCADDGRQVLHTHPKRAIGKPGNGSIGVFGLPDQVIGRSISLETDKVLDMNDGRPAFVLHKICRRICARVLYPAGVDLSL